jgi:hypothetical protein
MKFMSVPELLPTVLNTIRWQNHRADGFIPRMKNNNSSLDPIVT